MVTTCEVRLWGRVIGGLSWDAQKALAYFEYTKDFQKSGVQISPLKMPLGPLIFSFPEMIRSSFNGLPGVFADSLPDRYGSDLLNVYLHNQNRSQESLNPIERLCYVGSRGMGALEFYPILGAYSEKPQKIEMESLLRVANSVLQERKNLKVRVRTGKEAEALRQLVRIGTSAGGARAKALVAWNPLTNELSSGQVDIAKGFSHWLLKFDGVDGNGDHDEVDPQGFGLVEFAYHRMAVAAGMRMTECRLLHENGRNHFMTRRFDRTPTGEKLHMSTLGGLTHFDYNIPGLGSYEAAFGVCEQLHLSIEEKEELFRRMAFNVLARNQDDHVKNIAFLMNKKGQWSLAPAYDLTFSYNPQGAWTSIHQMSLNGKRDDFVLQDFVDCGKHVLLKRGRAQKIVLEVQDALSKWPSLAKDCGIPAKTHSKLAKYFRRLIK